MWIELCLDASFCFPFGHLGRFVGWTTFHSGFDTWGFLYGHLHGLFPVAILVHVPVIWFHFGCLFHFFFPLALAGFFAVFAEARNAAAVGAPLLPGLRMRSPEPDSMRARLAWMLE
jgi:hypothetical protein